MEVFLTDEQVEKIVELYVAYFNRAPEYQGLQFHLNIVVQQMQAAVDGGATVDQAFQAAYLDRADQFFDDAIATGEAGFSLGTTQQDFIEIVYRNVLQRYDDNNDGIGDVDPDLPPPSDAEIAFWVAQLNAGLTRGEMITSFIDSIDILLAQGTPEEMVIAQAQRDSLDNRVAVAEYFSQQSVSGQLTGANAQEAGRIALQGVTNDDATIQPAIDNITDLLTPDLDPSAASVDEGGTISFVLDTNFIDPGTQYVYTITGVSAADVVGGSLTGVVTLDSQGRAVINVTLAQDGVSEGPETITVSVAGVSTSAIVNDTSLTNFVLTAGADVAPQSTGTNFADTYTGTNTTLTQGDNLDGNDGIDTFNYSTTGGGSVNESGFVINDIERINVTVDNGGNGTVFDLSGVDTDGTNALQVVNNVNSSNDLTINGLRHTVDLEITTTSTGNSGSVDTTINYTAAATVGATTQNVLLTDVFNPSLGADLVPSSDDDLNGDDPIDGLPSNDTDLNVNGINGIENVAITTAGSTTSSIDDLNVEGLESVTVAGTQGLIIQDLEYDNTAGTGSFNASALTGGGVAVNFDNSGAIDINVLGSNQADVFDMQNGLSLGDVVDGNGGFDNLILSGNVLGTSDNTSTGTADGATVTGIEALRINTGFLGTEIDVTNFDDDLTDIWVNTLVGSINLVNLRSGQTIHVDEAQAQFIGETWTIDTLTGGSTVNFVINNIQGGATFNLTDEEFDTTPLPAGDGGLTTLSLFQNGAGELSTVDLTGLDGMTNLILGGSADQDLSGAGNGSFSLATIDGSASTGDLDLLGLNLPGQSMYVQSGVSITTGSGDDIADGTNGADTFVGNAGDDTFDGFAGIDNISGGTGEDDLDGGTGNDIIDGGADDDLITGGSGADQLTGGTGADVFHYNLASDSQGVLIDTITDFETGVDEIDVLDAIEAASGSIVNPGDFIFAGNAAGLAAAETALSGLGTAEAVFDTVNRQLYIDIDGNGDIDGAVDIIINLPTVTALSSGDLAGAFGDFTIFTANTAGFDTSDPNDSVEGIATLDNVNNSIRATAAQLVGATISGGGSSVGDTDTLNVTTVLGAFDFTNGGDINTIEDIDFLNLRLGTSGAVLGPQLAGLTTNLGAAGNFTTGAVTGSAQQVNGSNAGDIITLSNDGDSADGRGGADVFNISGTYNATVLGGAGNDAVVLAAGTDLGSNAVLNGGGNGNDELQVLGNADITAANISGFDQLDFQGGGTVSLTVDQYNGLLNTADRVEDSNGGGTENLIFFGTGAVVNLDSDINDVTIGDDSAQNFVLGDDGTNFLGGGNGDTTVTSNFASPNGDYNLGGGNDTFIQTVDADFDTGDDPTFTSVETLQLNSGVDINQMLAFQHNSFNNINGIGLNSITMNDALTGGVALFGSIETYNLSTASDNVTVSQGNDDVNLGNTNANTVTNNGVTDVNIDGGNAADTFFISGVVTGSTYSGGGGADVFNVSGASGFSISSSGTYNLSGTLSGSISTGTSTNNFASGLNIVDVTTNHVPGADTVTFQGGAGTYTMNAAQYNNDYINVAAANSTGLDLTDTIIIANPTATPNAAVSVAFGNQVAPALGSSLFGTLTIATPGADTVTFTSFDNATAPRTLNLSGGGSDDVIINNVSINTPAGEFNAANALNINDFDVANDQLSLQIGGVANGTFQTVSTADTDLTIAANGIVEITTAIGTLLAPTNEAAVEALLDAALGTSGAVGAGNFHAILYGNGNAYIYDINLNGFAALDIADGSMDDIELVGVINGVTADSLGASNFFV